MRTRVIGVWLACCALGGCLQIVSSQGGGEAKTPRGERPIRVGDVALPPGYRLELVARDFTYPSAVAFDAAGAVYVVESGYMAGEHSTTARVVRVGENGEKTTVVEGRNGPWTGVQISGDALVVAEGGNDIGGRIVRYTKDGKDPKVLVDGLPSLGDHHTNSPVIKDGYVYFGQGTATNAGIVGPDNFAFGWLKTHPDFHDVPCKDVKLTGLNRESENPLAKDAPDVETGAYSPFGTATHEGQVIKGQLPCSGAVMRVPIDGGAVELVAWGFRNPYGLAFAPDGQLWVADNGYDERGSRPVFGSADWLWKIEPGKWYGWPDYADGRPLTMDRYNGKRGPNPGRILAEIPNEAPVPTAFFGVHSSSDGIAFSTSAAFGHVGQAFVAQFGDEAGVVGKTLNPVGFQIVRVDPNTGVIESFAANRGWPNGPASKLEEGGLERPIDCKFDPTGRALYVVDFGTVLVDDEVVDPIPRSGVLWRIVKAG